MAETPKKRWGDDSDSDESVSKREDLKPDFVETKAPGTSGDDDSVNIRVVTSPKNLRTPVGSPKSILKSPKEKPRSPMGSPKSMGPFSNNSSPEKKRGGKSISQTDRRRGEGNRNRGEIHGSRERLPLGGGDVRTSENARERTSRSGDRTPRAKDTPKNRTEDAPPETPRSYQKLQLLPRSTSNEQSLPSQSSKLFGEAKPRELVLAARKEKAETDTPRSSTSGMVGDSPPSLSPSAAGESMPPEEPMVVRKFSGRGGRRGNLVSIEPNLGRIKTGPNGDNGPDSTRSETSLSQGPGEDYSGNGRNEGSDTSRSVSLERRVDSARNSFSKDDDGSKRADDRGSFSRGKIVSRESSRSSRGAESSNGENPRTSESHGKDDTIQGLTSYRAKSSEEAKTRGAGRGSSTASEGRSVSSRSRCTGEESESTRGGRTKGWGRGGCTVKTEVKEPKDKDPKDKDPKDKEAKSPLNRFEALAEDESDH